MKNKLESSKKMQHKIFNGILIVVFIVIALHFIISLVIDKNYPTGKIYNGTITDACKQAVGTKAPKNCVLVTLDNRTIVEMDTASMIDWKLGKRIAVEEMSSMRFRVKAYRFVKYIETNGDSP